LFREKRVRSNESVPRAVASAVLIANPLATACGTDYERVKGERMIIKLLIVFGALIVVALTTLAVLRGW
jgi:hypothetical protein